MTPIHPSDLKIEKVYLTDTRILTIYPEKGHRVRMSTLKVECDFDIFFSDKKGSTRDFLISLTIKGNEEEKPGYFFEVGSVGEFSLKNAANVDEKLEKQYILYTALPMLINSARIYIQQMTALHAFGSYLLPAIDLEALLREKAEEEEEE